MSQGPVPAPESTVPLDPELPELPPEPAPLLDPELPEVPLEPEPPLDPELPEVPLEPEPPLDPEAPELPLEPELPRDPEADPLLASCVLASGDEPELSLLEPQAQNVAVAAVTAKRVRARMTGSFLP
jgi:hypothetical protein